MIIKRNNITQTEKIRMLSAAIKVSERFARLLIGRGISDKESAEKFLYANFSDLSSPYSYDGVDKAAEIISYHVANRNKIVVYGDYDCDGISAVSILMRALAEKGADIDYYIPVRQEEGYGLNKEAISKIKSEYNPDLLITVDCGITAVNEIEFAKNLGIEVIVTDHHTVGSTIPECTVVDPCLNKNATPLCGAGVAFTLIRALYGDNYAKKYADICAVATVADIVPLVDDNRIIVKSGLEQIKRGYGKVGLNALLDVSGIDRKKLTSYDIGFKIAPRLNASGRLSTAHNSVKLLTTDDVTEAKFIAEELSIQNLERQEIGKQIFNEASLLLRGYNFADNKIVVLYGENWREGVIGISAAKLTEYFNMPTILLTDSADGMLKGSARSINGINIYELIATQRDKLTAFGGHAMAAGLSLAKNNFKSFFEGINSAAKKYPTETFARVTVCDDELSVSEISADFL
ncbi:MAG: single-stranded-DNA-specific exonuclease RecJ, partial [Christensenellales bacterium]